MINKIISYGLKHPVIKISHSNWVVTGTCGLNGILTSVDIFFNSALPTLKKIDENTNDSIWNKYAKWINEYYSTKNRFSREYSGSYNTKNEDYYEKSCAQLALIIARREYSGCKIIRISYDTIEIGVYDMNGNGEITFGKNYVNMKMKELL